MISAGAPGNGADWPVAVSATPRISRNCASGPTPVGLSTTSATSGCRSTLRYLALWAMLCP